MNGCQGETLNPPPSLPILGLVAPILIIHDQISD